MALKRKDLMKTETISCKESGGLTYIFITPNSDSLEYNRLSEMRIRAAISAFSLVKEHSEILSTGCYEYDAERFMRLTRNIWRYRDFIESCKCKMDKITKI